MVNARWTADVRSMYLLNGAPSWTFNKPSLHVLSVLPEYYVNQNDEMTLPTLYFLHVFKQLGETPLKY
jgi:hypothetical protein